MEEKRSGEFVGAFPSYGYIKNPEDIFNFYINNLPQEYKSGKIPRQLQQYEIKNKRYFDKLYNIFNDIIFFFCFLFNFL